MGNKEALIRRAKLHKKKIHFTKNLGLHKGNGDINLINVPYHSEVVAGKPNQKNSMLQLKMIDYGVSNCLNKNYDALVTLPISKEVLSSNKFSYRKGMIIHFVLINITVGFLYYQPGFGLESLLLVLATSITIYIVILLILLLREKQFINSANNIFKENKE